MRLIIVLILFGGFTLKTMAQYDKMQLINNIDFCFEKSDSLKLDNQLHIKISNRLNQVRNILLLTDSLKLFFETDTIFFIQSYSDGFVKGTTWNNRCKVIKFYSTPNNPDVVSFCDEDAYSKELINYVASWDINKILNNKKEVVILPTSFCYVARIINNKNKFKDISCLFFKLNI